ncbi:MAG TPA: putative Ig domain-containing protein [Pseudoxanthomonas sp.]|nr:putative Ig domain-containing protein [Pseudoxanthomonas sp.]
MYRSSQIRPGGRVHSFFLTLVMLAAAWLPATAFAQVLQVWPATNIPDATVGTPYTQIFDGMGGFAPYDFEIATGAVPPGLSLQPSGFLVGTPTAAGSYTFTVRVNDVMLDTGTRQYTLVVLPNTPQAPVAISGSATVTYNSGLVPIAYGTTGGTPTTIALQSMPAHGTVFINGLDLGYQPNFNYSGPDSFTYTASNTGGTSAPATITITVDQPTISVSASGPWTAQIGVPYTQTLTWSGGAQPFSGYQVTGLPQGVNLTGITANSVTLSGTPTASGNFNVIASATDSSTGTGPFRPSQNFNLSVSAPTLTLSPAAGTLLADYGIAYSQTYVAGGGTPNYTYSIIAGALPNGLSLDPSTGVLSGVPTVTGLYTFSVRARDNSTGTGAPYARTQNYVMQVAAPIITVNPAVLSGATAGVPTSQQLSASGGIGPYSYAASGTFPNGITLNSTGLLSGTAAGAGTYNVEVTATDANGQTGSRPYVLMVAPPTLSIQPSALSDTTVGASYSQTLSTIGGTSPYSYSVTSGAMPPGITLAPSGVLSGEPVAANSYTFTVTVTDSNGDSAPRSYTLVVNPATLTLSSSAPLDGTAGVFQTATITASGGVGTYTYSLRSGSLPVGVSFNSAGLFTGTPRSDGNYSITVRATDQLGQFGEAVFAYTIAPATIVIAPATLPGGSRGAFYNESLNSTGGFAPYSYSLVSGDLPVGMSLSSAGTLLGTPATTGSYTFNIRSTDVEGYSVTQAYTVVIALPTITVTSTGALNGTVGQPASVTFSASGGIGPYSYTLDSGTLPLGMTLSSSGTLSGTPLSDGSFSPTLRADDSYGNSGTQTFNITIAPPTIVLTPNALGNGVRGSEYSTTLSASGGTAPYSYAITAGALPAGVTLAPGGVLSGTPTVDGTFNVTITATDAYGSTGSHAYTLTINAAPPTSADDVAQVLSGGSVSIDVTDNDSGVITSIAIASAPSHGTTTVSGLNVVYTPATDYSGTDSFTYIATGPGGSSAPATVTVTVNPLPVAVSRTVTASAGLAVEVDLTEGATGGPFTAATLVSLTPAQAGTATIAQQGTGANARYVLTFTPVATFSGVATATFTLDNAFATSAEASIEFQVTARPDPTLDAEVQGLLSAQAQATRRFATAQLNNFQRRLESLHHGGSGFTNAVTFQANTPHCRDGMQGMQDLPNQLCDARTSERDGANPGLRDASAVDAESGEPGNRPFGLWTGGAIRSGNQDSQNNRARVDFETDGLSVGGDYRVNDTFAIGLGLGWGRDDSEIGDHGSRSKGKAYTLAGYASYHPGKLFLDALFGYQDLSYDLRRYVAANGGYVSGSRDGGQWFASLSTGADLSFNTFNLTPYARLDLARATLDAYTEQGDALYALHYQDMDVDSSTGNLGLRMDFQHKTHWGSLRPQLRLEYQYDFQGNGSATMQYADLMSGPFYRTSLPVFDRSRFLLGIGLGVIGDHGLSTRIEYNGVVDDSNGTDHGVMINIEKRY